LILPILSFHSYFDFFPDGRKVVITDNNKVLVYNLETTKLLEIAVLSNSPRSSLEVSPDGNLILYSTHEGIFIMNSDGTNAQMILPRIATHIRIGSVGFEAINPTWHPDGKHIVYQNIAITGTIPCCAGCYCLSPGYGYKGIVSIRKIRVF
jgi:Tol biopolymer transport system component